MVDFRAGWSILGQVVDFGAGVSILGQVVDFTELCLQSLLSNLTSIPAGAREVALTEIVEI